MAALIRKYTIGKSRLIRGLSNGFTVSPKGILVAEAGVMQHTLFLGRIDAGQLDCRWGRFCFDACLSEESAITVGAFASNDLEFINHQQTVGYQQFLLDPEVSVDRKEKLFSLSNGSWFTGAADMLLYEQRGRYLWIFIQLLGEQQATLQNFNVYVPGDLFFKTFPEIYQNNGEFLHRYLSIFSSLYIDLQTTIDNLESYVDLDTAPAKLLPVFAKWLGIELEGDFLEEDVLRRLLKNAYFLIRGKGSRDAIKRLAELFVEEPLYIMERRLFQVGEEGNEEAYNRLYGKDRRSFTLLINRSPDEKLHARLLYLIHQFQPLGTRAAIVFLGKGFCMDTHCYLDMNAQIAKPASGRLDERYGLNDIILLDE